MRFCPNCRKPSLDSRKRAKMLCKFRRSVDRVAGIRVEARTSSYAGFGYPSVVVPATLAQKPANRHWVPAGIPADRHRREFLVETVDTT